MKAKRLIISTLVGLLFGLGSYSIISSGSNFVPSLLTISIILSNALIGFTIGISTLKLSHWSFHGIVIGFIISLPLAGFVAINGGNIEFTRGVMMVLSLFLGMTNGFLIELVTTVILQAKQVRPKNSIL